MISEIRIQNFKSICDLKLKLGRVTVLIGENGSGKSNILEAIAFAGGASTNKLDNEFLFNRGIRVTEWKWMQGAFLNHQEGESNRRQILFAVRDGGLNDELTYEVQPEFLSEDDSFLEWSVANSPDDRDLGVARNEMTQTDRVKALEDLKTKIIDILGSESKKGKMIVNAFAALDDKIRIDVAAGRHRAARSAAFSEATGLSDFLIYAPENTVLRTPPPEGAIQPLGAKGEGLFKLLQSFADPKFSDRLKDMKERLSLVGWFEDFEIPDDAATAQARLQIRDRWLAPELAVFDQRSANEGFLYLLFYLTLLASWRTPRFFAIDNMDSALNPKLCAVLMEQIAELALKYDKQVICTTHNPAMLDGLNLNDDQQRLYTVRRDSEGHTIVRRVRAPEPQPGETPMRLSEAYTRGLIGGLPDNF